MVHSWGRIFLNGRLEGMEAFRERRMVASGGSLTCVLYIGLQKDDHAMVVCNPVAETAKWLPPLKLAASIEASVGALYVMFENHVRS